MRKKPLALRIFIRICVVFMALSLIWVYVVYMFSPTTSNENPDTWTDIQIDTQWDDYELIMPEINPDDPESTAAPIVITEDEELEVQVVD